MPLTRRRALACFYCGSKSSYQTGTVRQFKCDSCEAENYLDKNGQITDPPAHDSCGQSSQVRYARATDRSPSPTPNYDEDIFCRTCLKNQYLLSETLASYLPAEDHPQYEQYLDSYDEYRQKLEQRYPQICSQCAPKARARIKSATYMAKTDHLKRMMDRSRHVGVDKGIIGRLLTSVIRIAAVCFVSSALLQASWHVLAALILVPSPAGGMDGGLIQRLSTNQLSGDATLASCFHHVYQDRIINPLCVTQYYERIPVLLLTALMTAWWNPQLLRRYMRGGGTMVHLQQYYILQGIVLSARAVAFHFLDTASTTMRVDVLKGCHLFMAMFIVASLLVSVRIVRLEHKSPVSFLLTDDALLPNVPPASGTSIQASTNASRGSPMHQFSIKSLALPGVTAAITPRASYQSPTPPRGNDDDPDAMDWTPTNKTFAPLVNPSSRLTRSASKINPQTEPSPFRGTLPPAPLPPAHRLRRPPAMAPGAFRMASETQKNHFTNSLRDAASASGTDSAYGNGKRNDENAYETDTTITDTEDERRGRKFVGKRKGNIELAQPKFWPQDDINRKTGLEDIFEEGFNINDTPREVRRRATGAGNDILKSDIPLVDPGLRERWGGFGAVTDADGMQADLPVASQVEGWWSILAICSVPVACLGIAFAVVKGGYI